MHITLSPMRALPGRPETNIRVDGDLLTVDGVDYDLSGVPEGGEAVPQGEDHPFAGVITRAGGTIRCTLRVRLGDDATPVQPADPAHWIVEQASGAVELPAIRKPQESENA